MAGPRDNSLTYDSMNRTTSVSSYVEDAGEDLLFRTSFVYEAKEPLAESSKGSSLLVWSRQSTEYKDMNKRRSRFIQWARMFTMLVTVLTLISAIVIWIGARVQFKRARRAPSTVTYYTMPTVCAATSDTPLDQDTFLTFDNASSAHLHSHKVVHCGACAHCSNLNDIEKYVVMRHNLTSSSYSCAMKGLWRGRKAAHACMDSKVGFSWQCTDCWLNDIQCSIQNCLIPCLKYKLFREPNNKRDGSLNDCLACDEKLCGPAFIECSGVNRRRLGISSDIGRSDKIENCATTDFPWLNMTFS